MQPRSLRTAPTLAELEIETVPWEDLGPAFMAQWGRPRGRFDPEHVTVYGPTGSGKTYFVREILRQRAEARGSHVVIVATKRADATLTSLGWPIIQTWPPGHGEYQVIYWAKAKGISAQHRIPQRAKIKTLMDQLWTPGSNRVVYWDELPYLEEALQLKAELHNFYREGRALGITNVASMQRPAGVTRLAHSEAGWTVAFRAKDVDDRDRVAEVLGDRARFRHAIEALDRGRHEFLIRHDRTGEVYVSHLPKPSRTRVRSAGKRTQAGG